MRTVQQVITRVREILQDSAGVRYTDAELTSHLLDAIQACRTVRPDLFLGQYAADLPDGLDLEDPLPVPDHFFAAISLYVAGCAELRDDEFAVDNRAMTLRNALNAKLVSGI